MEAADASATVGATRALQPLRFGSSPAPALDAEEHSLSARVGERLSGVHPVAVFLGGILVCYLVLASITVAAGVLFTETILPLGSLDEADSRPVEWLADQRTSALDDVSVVGSEISGGIVLPILVALLALGFAIRRHWLLAAFVIFGVALESATYRTTVFFVDRERPDVPRLEGLPPDASFPSGHVAASIAVYSGLALLLTSRMSSGFARVLVWAIAVSIPIVVGIARMYRGMHHPLDTLAGVLVGVAALAIVVFLARVTGVVARRRDALRGTG